MADCFNVYCITVMEPYMYMYIVGVYIFNSNISTSCLAGSFYQVLSTE